MPKNHRVCGRSRCSDICKVRMWRPRDGVHWEALRRALTDAKIVSRVTAGLSRAAQEFVDTQQSLRQ
eukprot:SAG25_NODE_5_length_29351_cov_43.404335_43_plen_67_part_00